MIELLIPIVTALVLGYVLGPYDEDLIDIERD